MQDDFCELRLDIPLPPNTDAHGFESAWRATVAQKRLAQAQPLSARFRLCCADLDAVRASVWTQYLTARLSALPGTPSVVAEASALPMPSDWHGVRVWLAYRSRDLTVLLTPKKSARFRGRRP